MEVSAVRKKCAKVLEKKITDALIELNFLQVNFKIEVRPLEEYTVNGIDEIEFMISTNPGEDMKPSIDKMKWIKIKKKKSLKLWKSVRQL